MKKSRSYDMTTRSVQAASSRLRILDATIQLSAEVPLAAITLPLVAERAGVTVQTVLRKFGNRDGLFDAAQEHGSQTVIAERRVDPDDLEVSLDGLMHHYDRVEVSTMMLLGQEAWEPRAAVVTAAGKALHRKWVEDVFVHALTPLDAAARVEAVDLLVVATDLYTYKLLRIDRGLSLGETRERMRRLIDAVLGIL